MVHLFGEATVVASPKDYHSGLALVKGRYTLL